MMMDCLVAEGGRGVHDTLPGASPASGADADECG